MKKRIVLHFLDDIFNAINAIERFTQGMTRSEFSLDEKTIRAVEREFEIIGEAVKKVPDSITSQYPHIPWKAIARMRDRLIHHYWKTDVDVLWQTIQESLPSFKTTIAQIIQENKDS